MKKKVKRSWKPFALLLTAVFMLSLLPRLVAPTLASNDIISITSQSQSFFTDVEAGSWYYDGVMYVVEKGIMSGTANDKFSPEGPLSVSMLNLGNLFPDITESQLFEGMAEWAASYGGDADSIINMLNSDEYITKEQLANLCYVIQRGSGRMINPVKANYDYRKWENINETVRPAVNALTTQGLFRDFPSNEFNSEDLAARAEAACMIYRYLTELERQNDTTSTGEQTQDDTANTGEQTQTPFTDVEADAWYSDAVMFVVEKGLMFGTSINTFSPNAPLTPAMINLDNLFDDMTAMELFAGMNEWVSGYGAEQDSGMSMFGLNDNLTKEELGEFSYLIERASGRMIDPTVLSDFYYSDWEQITNWIKPAIDLLSRQGIYRDFPTNEFRPKEPATRAEAASILYRYLTELENQGVTTGNDGRTTGDGAGRGTDEGNAGDLPSAEGFTDVAESAWYHDAAIYVVNKGLMTSTATGEFSPDSSLTPAMINLDNLFDDMTAEQLYEGIADWMSSNGISADSVSSMFDPNGHLKKEELAIFSFLIQQASGKTPDPIQKSTQYNDASKISIWAKSAVDLLTSQGIYRDIPGSDFKPQEPATRAEAACILYRYLTELEKQGIIAGNDEQTTGEDAAGSTEEGETAGSTEEEGAAGSTEEEDSAGSAEEEGAAGSAEEEGATGSAEEEGAAGSTEEEGAGALLDPNLFSHTEAGSSDWYNTLMDMITAGQTSGTAENISPDSSLTSELNNLDELLSAITAGQSQPVTYNLSIGYNIVAE